MVDFRSSPSGPIVVLELDTNQIENRSTVPGPDLTDALDALEPAIPARGSAAGYLARVWFTTPGTTLVFATAADLPAGDEIELVSWSGGGAGGNARFQNIGGTSQGGTAAGGGGARRAKRFSRAFLLTQLPISVLVGAAALPPAAPTVQLTDQISTIGTTSAWIGSGGPLVVVYGGGAGQNINQASGGSGGGFLGPGIQNSNTGPNLGGQPGGNALVSAGGFGGRAGKGGGAEGANEGGNSDRAFAATGGGGGGGGCARTIGGGVGSEGGNADEGGGGGGGGAPMDTTAIPASSKSGGPAGSSGLRSDGLQSGTGPAGGLAGDPGNPGADAPDLAPTDANYEKSGDGGGGGASSPIVGTTGGRGGNGGAPSGGGGGGGPGRGANGTAWGGVGGRGARGQGAYTIYL